MQVKDFMPIRKYTLPTTFSRLPGDEIRIVGNRVDVIRGGLVVQTWNLASLASELLTAAAFVGGSEIDALYLENRYMAAKTLTGFSVNEASGIVTAKFSDGANQELAEGHTDGIRIADELDANGDLAQNILIAAAYRHSPDGTALADAIGSSVMIDTAASNPVIFTPSPEIE